MKAYQVWDTRSVENCSTVVFAENGKEAKKMHLLVLSFPLPTELPRRTGIAIFRGVQAHPAQADKRLAVLHIVPIDLDVAPVVLVHLRETLHPDVDVVSMKLDNEAVQYAIGCIEEALSAVQGLEV